MQVTWISIEIFFVCNLGERVTYQFNEFNEKLHQCNWILFPIEIKRIYLFILLGSQRTVFIEGYLKTACTRETFKNVR